MVDFVNTVRSFVNYAIFRELRDRMRFEVDCTKSHHRVISEGLFLGRSPAKKLSSKFGSSQEYIIFLISGRMVRFFHILGDQN